MCISSDTLHGSPTADLREETPVYPQRRIRHITTIQVRNLTPFPVRDAFATALKQPSEQLQFTPHGHFSDDLDLTIGRKKARRLSSASSLTAGSSRHNTEQAQYEERMGTRRRLSSTSVLGTTPSSSPGMSRRLSNTAGVPTVRPHRQRTMSVASSTTVHTDSASRETWETSLSTSRFPDLLRDTSQKGLEKVLQSRLVETFITVTVPSSGFPSSVSDHRGSPNIQEAIDAHEATTSRASTPDSKPSSSRERAPSATRKNESSSKVSTEKSNITSSSSRASASRPPTSCLHSTTSSSTSPRGGPSYPKAASSSLPNANAKAPRSPSQKQQSSTSSKFQKPLLSSPASKFEGPLTPPSSPSHNEHRSQVEDGVGRAPDYLSPIHWPSTNPSFQVDARSGGEFIHDADLSASAMHVEVWGHVKRGFGWSSHVNGDPKDKGKNKDTSKRDSFEWKVLESWNVDLQDLVPLPEDLATHSSHLPSNTLLITLSPPGQIFYLPKPSSQVITTDSGYNSDPESEARKVRGADEIILPSQGDQCIPDQHINDSVLHFDNDQGTSLRRGRRRTASWQSLHRLSNLQACIVDTEESLSQIVREIDKLVAQPGLSSLCREVSERETWIGQLRDETADLDRQSVHLKNQIETRRKDLRRRREILAAARESNEQLSELEFDQEQEILDKRDTLDILRKQIGPMRSDLLTTLSFIFPIELVSPPDLLFTILDVPLPIPLGNTDPAPPLSLPAHKEVTEDALATALGYAAQLVQLLAAFLGKGLVYPVTCVGSRSLIRDGISAMVGPRMFPLFSKGVDTYRFEYGVFLLNKDVELLMSDRNLRALDMRHTLPNLKNLLLTLTGTDGTRPAPHRFSVASSSASISSMRSPILTASSLPTATEPALPTQAASNGPRQPEGLPVITTDIVTTAEETESPPLSGSTTPIPSAAESAASSRKSRTFLDFTTPLSGFWRGRYPSSSQPSVRSVAEMPEPAQEDLPSAATSAAENGSYSGMEGGSAEEHAESPDDEDDRRTIRGRGDATGDSEGKVDVTENGNGCAVPRKDGAGEKLAADGVHGLPTVLVSGSD